MPAFGSYHNDWPTCQICGVTLYIARIRTANEPPSAAWQMDGADYHGSRLERNGPTVFITRGVIQEEQDECTDCMTADRTPDDPRVLLPREFPVWPEEEDDSDGEWLPEKEEEEDDDMSSAHSERLEYDSEDEEEEGGEEGKEEQEQEQEEQEVEATDRLYTVSGLHLPPEQRLLPHGTWYRGLRYLQHFLPNHSRKEPITTSKGKVEREHIASPSCRLFDGINGHALSIAQMKNCRNVRYLVPKTAAWTAAEDEAILEQDSLFFLTGETNGSASEREWHSFHPPRHGLRHLMTYWPYVNRGCQDTTDLVSLPAHSYCLDLYAKASYHALGRVDLDGLWHWREIQTDPRAFGLDEPLSARRSELQRGHPGKSTPWHHVSGDEWLSANPVEVPGLSAALASCTANLFQGRRDHPHDDDDEHCEVVASLGPLLGRLPLEIITDILQFLEASGVDAVARSCRALYRCSQLTFKILATRDMPWLWELVDGNWYPPSRDWPPVWDPIFPPDISGPPKLSIRPEDEEEHARFWATIIEEYPEMVTVYKAVKEHNLEQNEKLMAPYRAKQEAALQEWHVFRERVAAWISCQGGGDDAQGQHSQAVEAEAGPGPDFDWRCLYWRCHPMNPCVPGLRNRERIWNDCQTILHYVGLGSATGQMERSRADILKKAMDPSQPGWTTLVNRDYG